MIRTLQGERPPTTLTGYLQTDLARQRAQMGLPVVDLQNFEGRGPASPEVTRMIGAFVQRVRRERARKPKVKLSALPKAKGPGGPMP